MVDGGITPMGWLMAGANVLGSALKPAPAAPSSADSVFGTSLAFDNSGWNVAFRGSTIDAPTDKTTNQGGATSPQDPMLAFMPYVVAAFGMVIAWKLLKKS